MSHFLNPDKTGSITVSLELPLTSSLSQSHIYIYGIMDPEYWGSCSSADDGNRVMHLGVNRPCSHIGLKRGTIIGYFCNGYISIFCGLFSADCFYFKCVQQEKNESPQNLHTKKSIVNILRYLISFCMLCTLGLINSLSLFQRDKLFFFHGITLQHSLHGCVQTNNNLTTSVASMGNGDVLINFLISM